MVNSRRFSDETHSVRMCNMSLLGHFFGAAHQGAPTADVFQRTEITALLMATIDNNLREINQALAQVGNSVRYQAISGSEGYADIKVKIRDLASYNPDRSYNLASNDIIAVVKPTDNPDIVTLKLIYPTREGDEGVNRYSEMPVANFTAATEVIRHARMWYAYLNDQEPNTHLKIEKKEHSGNYNPDFSQSAPMPVEA